MKESRGITPLRTILQNCLNHIENLETNRSTSNNYDKEFQDLKQFSETLKTQKEYSCTEGEKEVNKKKNRYKDILPFNISRVVLNEYAGIPGSDYINANYIRGASGSPAYIASQGPLPNTVNDFWRMVVECEVQVIVMACNSQESGKHKCENYWVEKEGEEKRFGMVQICLVKASTVCPDFLVRTMRLKYTNDKDVTEERTVCQFHYSAWPDHGVPPLVRPLLDMVRLVRDTQASETLPVLVHCSAGCGRTGTICAIDFVWGLLRAGKLTEDFSLFNLVKDMRKQRVAMVQTKEQYILVHQAVRELFKEQLQVIESHPYENIDFNGVPLIKDFEEPFYDTIGIQKEENCDEKQDKSEMKDKGEDCDRIAKIDAAPPLPRKKRPNVLFSKQEKEAENLTEKNRTSFAEKEKEKTDASLSSLLGKPRIVKLRALFEKSPTAKERGGLKDRGSQTVSRSHSLGAIRKPLSPEAFESQEKAKLNPPPCPDLGKLKHSKSFSRSVPLIKRSKSLKTFSQSSPLSVSPQETVVLKNYRKSLEEEGEVKPWKNSNETESKRRRSLESLIGDVPPSVTWPRGADPKSDLKARQKSLDWTPKLSTVPSTKATDILRHRLQKLSLEKERKMNSFAIGIRERRNSFRQAVSKSNVHANENVKSIDQPDGTSDWKYRLQDKPDDQRQKLKHLQLERIPKTVQTKESPSKNLFLKKLNSEIYDNHRDIYPQETRSRTVNEESDKGSRFNPLLVRCDSKKMFKANITVKPPEEIGSSNGKDSERTYQTIWQKVQHRPPKSYECYKCYAASPSTQSSSCQRPSPSHKSLSYQNSVDSNPKEQFYSIHKKTPPKEIEVTLSSYRKNAELYVLDGNDKKLALPPKLAVGKSSKTYEQMWCQTGPSRSSGEVSSSEHSSDSSRLCHFEGEGPVKNEAKIILKPEPFRSRIEGASKMSEQKKADEFMASTSVDFCNYGVVGTSKIRANTVEYSKDDFLVKEPTAPPRVKRHASVTVPRNILNGSDHVSSWLLPEGKSCPVRNTTFQSDKNAWNGTIGVDLDAVAASMQQDKKEVSSVLKDGIWSGNNHLGGSPYFNGKKKQHYL